MINGKDESHLLAYWTWFAPGAHRHDCLWKAHEGEDQVKDGPGDTENNTNATLQSLRMDVSDQEGF